MKNLDSQTLISVLYCILMNAMPAVALILAAGRSKGRKAGSGRAYLSGMMLMYAVMVPVAVIENIRMFRNIGNINVSVFWGFAIAAVITVFMTVKTESGKGKLITAVCLGMTGFLMMNYEAYFLNLALSLPYGKALYTIEGVSTGLAVTAAVLSVYCLPGAAKAGSRGRN